MAYATILIPTHDRAETLGHAVAAALGQTVRDISVLILGDGCTPPVRAVAQGWAGRDARVRFADLPKGAGAGAGHRDAALRRVTASRVFFSDDDDLLLPDHVATLGPALDRAEVVDTPVFSLCPDGRMQRGLHDMALPQVRAAVASGRSKPFFDVHLGLRAEAYARIMPPLTPHCPQPFPESLARLAGHPEVRWVTLDAITAISLHGKPRSGWSAAEREAEIAALAARSPPAADLRAAGQLAFGAVTLAWGLSAAGLDGGQAQALVGDLVTLRGRGLAQGHGMVALDALTGWAGGRIAPDRAAAVARALGGAALSPAPQAGQIAHLLHPSVGWAGLHAIATAAAPAPWALCLAALAEARLHGRIAASTLLALRALPEQASFGIGLELAQLTLTVLQDTDQATAWLDHARAHRHMAQHAGMIAALHELIAARRGALTAPVAGAN